MSKLLRSHRAPLAVAAALALLAVPAPPARAESGEESRDRVRERAEWNLAFRRDASGRVLPENRLKALRQACDLPVDPSMSPDPLGAHTRSEAGPSVPGTLTFNGTAWQSLGPTPINPLAVGSYAWTSASGRVTALAVHPTNPSTMLLGSATGGIWKSTNGGSTWRPVSDTAPSLATSSIAYAPSNPSTVYAATGEMDSTEYIPSNSLGMYLSAGLLRSLDGGESWTRVDTNLPAHSVLARVVVSASNPQVVLVGVHLVHDVAADRSVPGGLYKSTDGGVTFTRTFSHFISDLVADPNNPSVYLLGAGVNGGCPTCEDYGVWGSTDSGNSWFKVLTGGNTTLGQTKLTASRTNPAWYYASILDVENKHAGAAGIYRSTDGGGTWAKQSVEPTMCGEANNQCFYDHFITANPANPSTVFFGSVNMYRSDDGAASWTKLTPFYDGNTPATIHPDEHAGLFVGGTFFVGSDGGLYKTTDSGSSWTSLNSTLTLSQFNSISLHPTNASIAIGGTQDNGSPFYTGNVVWDDRTAGDGGNPLIRQDNPLYVFGPHYLAGFEVSTDGGSSFVYKPPCGTLMNCNTGDALEQMAFYAPTAAAPGAGGTLFVGTNRIWSNTTFGSDANAWSPRSGGAITSSFFTAIDVVGDGRGVVWGGTFQGAVYFSADGGSTFTNVSNGIGPGIISNVKAVSSDGYTAYITQGGFSGAPSQHVFRTTNGGQSWTNVSGNLPDAPVLSIAVDPTDANDLFVGTDVGVFRSTNGGASWASFNQGLPNVPVHDIRFGPTSGTLTAATYGRGVYRITTGGGGGNRPPTATITSPSGNVTISVGQSVSFAATASDPDGDAMTYAWSFGDGTTSSALSPGAHAYGTAGTKVVTFVATDSHGASSSVQTRTITVTGGGGGGGNASATKFVPIVLDVAGGGGARFSTELTLANRGTTSATVTLTYTPASSLNASGSGSVSLSVGARSQVVIADTIAYLRQGGIPIPADGTNQGGTLSVAFNGLSDGNVAYAGARTTTPSNTGRAGLSYPGLNADQLFTSTPAWIYGLRQNDNDRTNLAMANASMTSSVTLRVTIWNADGSRYYRLTPDTTLGPGQWTQISKVLTIPGIAAGYASVEMMTGSGPFYAYGVFNDSRTNDGSYVPPMPNSYWIEPQTLPVLVETATFSSEMVLVNYTNKSASISLNYVESLAGGGGGGSITETLNPFQQKIIPDAIQYLRSRGMSLPARGSTSLAGSVKASFRTNGSADGGFVGARTSAPWPGGGQYGLFYVGAGSHDAATSEAWVFGLQENSSVRSNLAVANLGTSGDAIVFRIEVYDGDRGTMAGQSIDYTLSPGGWIQLSKVLPTFGASNGFARVVKISGSSKLIAYGVVNDGATSTSGATNDGSYIAFAND